MKYLLNLQFSHTYKLNKDLQVKVDQVVKKQQNIFIVFIIFKLIPMQAENIVQNIQNSFKDKTSVFVWGLFLDKKKRFPVPTVVKELENKAIQKVKSGGFFYLAVTKDGKLYGWGNTKYSRFGIGGDDFQIPKLVPLKYKVRNIAAGNWHSLITDQNKKLYAVGHNKYGECGDGTFNNLQVYTPTLLNQQVENISAGDGISLILTNKKELFSCGYVKFHGHKTKQHISKPKKLNISQNNIVSIAAGFSHCLAVDQSGKTYSWGEGNFFQLGHGNDQDQKQPKLIHALNNQKIVDVSCTRGQKYSHSLAVSQNGKLYSWGSGYKGKLGHYQQWDHSDPADQPVPRQVKLDYKVIKCSGGGIHSMILNQMGEALSFGCGSDHRLGHLQSLDHKYLYRQGKPRKIQALNEWKVIQLQCSYYHNICLGYKNQIHKTQ